MANNVQAIKALPEPVHSLITGAFASSLHDMFLTAVPIVMVAFVIALFLKEKPLAQRDGRCSRGGRSRSRDVAAALSCAPVAVRPRPGSSAASRSVRARVGQVQHHGVRRRHERYGDQGAGDAGHQHAGRDRDDHAERVHRDQPADQERLQHVRLELLHRRSPRRA